VSFHGGNVSPESPASVAIDNFVLYRGDDAKPPEPVADLSAEAKDGVVTLTWSRPQDDLFAVRYEVYRSADPEAPPVEDRMLSTVHTLTFDDDTVVNPGTYHYRVVACDFAGNRSAASNAVSVTLDDDGDPVSEGERE
jgi:hypothetical protein